MHLSKLRSSGGPVGAPSAPIHSSALPWPPLPVPALRPTVSRASKPTCLQPCPAPSRHQPGCPGRLSVLMRFFREGAEGGGGGSSSHEALPPGSAPAPNAAPQPTPAAASANAGAAPGVPAQAPGVRGAGDSSQPRLGAVPFVPTTRNHQQFHHHQQEPPTAASKQLQQEQQEEEQDEALAGRRVEGAQVADRNSKEGAVRGAPLGAAVGMGAEDEEGGGQEEQQWEEEDGEEEEEHEESLVAAAVHAQKGATAEDARERQLDRAAGAGPPWGRAQVAFDPFPQYEMGEEEQDAYDVEELLEYVPASQVEGAVVLGEAAPSGLPLSGEGHADQLSAALDALAEQEALEQLQQRTAAARRRRGRPPSTARPVVQPASGPGPVPDPAAVLDQSRGSGTAAAGTSGAARLEGDTKPRRRKTSVRNEVPVTPAAVFHTSPDVMDEDVDPQLHPGKTQQQQQQQQQGQHGKRGRRGHRKGAAAAEAVEEQGGGGDVGGALTGEAALVAAAKARYARRQGKGEGDGEQDGGGLDQGRGRKQAPGEAVDKGNGVARRGRGRGATVVAQRDEGVEEREREAGGADKEAAGKEKKRRQKSKLSSLLAQPPVYKNSPDVQDEDLPAPPGRKVVSAAARSSGGSGGGGAVARSKARSSAAGASSQAPAAAPVASAPAAHPPHLQQHQGEGGRLKSLSDVDRQFIDLDGGINWDEAAKDLRGSTRATSPRSGRGRTHQQHHQQEPQGALPPSLPAPSAVQRPMPESSGVQSVGGGAAAVGCSAAAGSSPRAAAGLPAAPSGISAAAAPTAIAGDSGGGGGGDGGSASLQPRPTAAAAVTSQTYGQCRTAAVLQAHGLQLSRVQGPTPERVRSALKVIRGGAPPPPPPPPPQAPIPPPGPTAPDAPEPTASAPVLVAPSIPTTNGSGAGTASAAVGTYGTEAEAAAGRGSLLAAPLHHAMAVAAEAATRPDASEEELREQQDAASAAAVSRLLAVQRLSRDGGEAVLDVSVGEQQLMNRAPGLVLGQTEINPEEVVADPSFPLETSPVNVDALPAAGGAAADPLDPSLLQLDDPHDPHGTAGSVMAGAGVEEPIIRPGVMEMRAGGGGLERLSRDDTHDYGCPEDYDEVMGQIRDSQRSGWTEDGLPAGSFRSDVY